jgi:hypothetical protein
MNEQDRKDSDEKIAAFRGVCKSIEKLVALTKLSNGCEVTTVWLGLDHSHRKVGPPMIFETIVWGPNDTEVDVKRYESEDEAIAGHAALCAQYSRLPDGPMF